MITIKKLRSLQIPAILAMGSLLALADCNQNAAIDYSSDDNANVQSEVNSDSQLEEVDDMAAVAVSSDAATISGREEVVISDDRFTCATVTLDRATSANPPVNTILNPHGFITIDFGSGCSGPGGRRRTGKIIFEYIGRRFLPNSKIITTFQNFYVNGIKIEGTRTLSNTSVNETSAVSFSILEEGMKVTYPDGTFATRTSSRIRTWNRTTSPTGDVWTVKGSAVGTNRKGKDYVMTITKELLYKRSCAISNKVFMPVSGIKDLKVGSKEVTVDYGEGGCNTKVKITILGKSKEVEPTPDGN